MSEGPSMSAPLVSVIIPVYNTEKYLRACLDSVLQQTMEDFELIIIDDGSTDSSPGIIEEYTGRDSRIVHHRQENAGQGVARNVAMRLARGKYILFVDSDDFIERVTLKVTTERAEQDSSDLVHFDWKLVTNDSTGKEQFHYYNVTPYWGRTDLTGHECAELLRVKNLYAWNSLYRREFLMRNEIFFEEGRIYEDNPFVVKVVATADHISLVQSPLYSLRPNEGSTTRSFTTTSKHMEDHLYAIERSYALINSERTAMSAYIGAYHLHKYFNYSGSRIPKNLRRQYRDRLLQTIETTNIQETAQTDKFYRTCAQLNVFEKERQLLFSALVTLKKLVGIAKSLKKRVKKYKKHLTLAARQQVASQKASTQELKHNTIFFLGFDFRYVGNSRYLFESLIADVSFGSYEIKFMTNDVRVPEQYRMDPRKPSSWSQLSKAKIVIAESWTPEHLVKHPDSLWVQLWHGNPLKKMLFDAPEKNITMRRPNNKHLKFRDIQRWDYFVVDHPESVQIFETAFLLPHTKMLHATYPRVQYLAQRSSQITKQQVKVEIFGKDNSAKQIIFYAPTWRDQNYNKAPDVRDSSHLLPMDALAEALGENYLVVFRDHSYMSADVRVSHPNVIDVSDSDIDTQDLILASDLVISDYSSILYDAEVLNTPVILYTPDHDTFTQNRGIYHEAYSRFSEQQVQTFEELVKKMDSCRSGASTINNSRDLCSESSLETQLLTLRPLHASSLTSG